MQSGGSCIRMSRRPMTIEYLDGRPIGPDELDTIRRELETMDRIDTISNEVRALIPRVKFGSTNSEGPLTMEI